MSKKNGCKISKGFVFWCTIFQGLCLNGRTKNNFAFVHSKGIIPQPDDDVAQEHFQILVDKLSENGFIHYELSNFGKKIFFKNNSSYWLGKKYIGIGPSAHSYDGKNRGWNVSNNSLYIKSIQRK